MRFQSQSFHKQYKRQLNAGRQLLIRYSNALWFLLQLVLFAYGLYLYVVPAVPGRAVAILGAIAALMSFATGGVKRRLCWILVVTVFCSAELKAIRVDRNQALRDQVIQNDKFNRIAVELKAAWNQSEAHYTWTQAKDDAIAQTALRAVTVAQRAVDVSTGGNSFAVVSLFLQAPTDEDTFELIATGQGKYPLHSLTFSITDMRDFDEQVKKHLQLFPDLATHIVVGDFPPGGFAFLRNYVNLKGRTHAEFFMYGLGLNGTWREELHVVKLSQGWRQAYKVTRMGPHKAYEIYEWGQPDFPRMSGHLVWQGLAKN